MGEPVDARTRRRAGLCGHVQAPINASVEAFALTNGKLATSPTSKSQEVYRGDTKTFIARGGTMAISANGRRNGILWTLQSNGDQNPGTLHAYDAHELRHELYNSDEAGARDSLDPWLKFTVPWWRMDACTSPALTSSRRSDFCADPALGSNPGHPTI